MKKDLFTLIHSLTKSEKRHFKLHCSSYSGEKGYLALFNAIEQQKKANDNELKKKFVGNVLAKNLHLTKNYLFKLILKTLKSYYAQKSSISVLNQLLEELPILFEKGILPSFEKKLTQGIQLADEHEEFYLRLELLQWEKKLSRKTIIKKEKAFEKLLQKELLLIKKAENAATYSFLLDEVSELHLQEGGSRSQKVTDEINQLMKHPLLKNKSKALSWKATLSYYNIHSKVAFMRYDYKSELRHRLKSVSFIEAYPLKIRNNPIIYLNLLRDLLISYYSLNLFKQGFYDTLDKLKSFPTTKLYQKSDLIKVDFFIFQAITPIELSTLLHWGKAKEALELISTTQKKLLHYFGKNPDSTEIRSFYTFFFFTYFMNQDYHQAQYWLKKMSKHLSFRSDLSAMIRVLELINQYELGDFDFVDDNLRNAHLYLKKKEKLYVFEKLILSFFRNELPKTDNEKKAVTAAFSNLKKELLLVMKDPNEAIIVTYFDFISWIDSKIQDRPFAEIMKEKAGLMN